jgi:integrase
MDFRWRGKRYRISTGIPDRDENEKFVRDWDATIRREIALGTFQLKNHFPQLEPVAPSDKRTVKDDCEAWLKAHKNSWAEWTYRKHRDNLESRIYAKIGDKITRELKPIDLRLLRESIIEEGKVKGGGKLSNRRVNRIMLPLTATINELFDDGELEANPAARVKKLKEKRIAEIDPFSDEELEVIFKTADRHWPWYSDYIRNLFASGFRLEEHNGQIWSLVNFVTQTIQIREVRTLEKQKDPKTEFALRDAIMTKEMIPCYKRQKARSYLKHEFVWVTETGEPIDVSKFRANVWVPLIKKTGLRYRYPNQARHTFATKHIAAGEDPTWIAKQMGTSLEQVFGTYTAEFDRRRRNALSREWSRGGKRLLTKAKNPELDQQDAPVVKRISRGSPEP